MNYLSNLLLSDFELFIALNFSSLLSNAVIISCD